MKVEVTWVEGMEFRSDSESGHSWNMDASVDVGEAIGVPGQQNYCFRQWEAVPVLISSVSSENAAAFDGSALLSGSGQRSIPAGLPMLSCIMLLPVMACRRNRCPGSGTSVEKYCSVLSSLNAEVTYDFEVVQSEADA